MSFVFASGLSLAFAALSFVDALPAVGNDPQGPPAGYPSADVFRGPTDVLPPGRADRSSMRGSSDAGSASADTGGATAAGGSAPNGAPARPSGVRGTALEALETETWGAWWAWNRGVFELPEAVAAAQFSEIPGSARTEALRVLERMARAPESIVRGAAAQALGRIGVPADQLLPFFADEAREVRLLALLGLGCGGTAAHARILAAQMGADPQGDVLAVAIASFTLLDESPARQMLASTVLDRVTDTRPAVQVAASLAAASASTDHGRTAARRLLREGTTSLQRALAAEMLGAGATTDDVTTLTALVNDRSSAVRRSASLALGQSRHAQALPVLQTAFDAERDLGTRAMQLLAMGDHGGDAARSFLRRQLVEGSKPLRAFAALAMALAGRDRADAAGIAKEIEAALAVERNRDQRGAYVLALGLLENEPSRPLFVASLATGEDPLMRGAAVWALGLLRGAASREPLSNALSSDSNPWVRGQAAIALGQLGRDAVDDLTAALWAEKEDQVRSAILWSLGGIADARASSMLLSCAGDASLPAVTRAAGAAAIGRAFRHREPCFPKLRFQHNNLLIPDITAWAFAQEL